MSNSLTVISNFYSNNIEQNVHVAPLDVVPGISAIYTHTTSRKILHSTHKQSIAIQCTEVQKNLIKCREKSRE